MFERGTIVVAEIDDTFRNDVVKNHTATHLLHQALRDVLGEHIHQAGSLVSPERLRFDFTHFEAVNEEQLLEIERIVNEKIWQNISVNIEAMTMDEAKKVGAMALFDEKYGDIVRVVQIGDYSIELCGGCHVNNSAEIGLFKIVSESGIGAGTRRIEAVTGRQAYSFLDERIGKLRQVASLLKTNEQKVIERVESLLEQMKELERENESFAAKLANEEVDALVNNVTDIDGVNVLAEKVHVTDMNQLRTMLDTLKERLPTSVIVLAAEANGRVLLVAGATKDAIARNMHAGKLIGEVAKVCGGGGGGRPDMAQAGGKDVTKVKEALQIVPKYVENNVT